jgi:CubicO group peptidase (beta-lactamase class C family)
VRELLHHTGGWDSTSSGDPMFRPLTIARAMGTDPPPSCETVIRYMLGKPLEFTPGTRNAYSNFGYCVLGRIVERASGQGYEEYVRDHVFAPIGVTRARIGRSFPEARAPGEVRYYDYPGASLGESAFPGLPGPVPRPYGWYSVEALDSLGGWLISAADLLRFVVAVDGERAPSLLSGETVELMLERPAPPVSVGASVYYGLGWNVRPAGGDRTWWHAGSLPGTRTLVVRAGNGLAWSALFNSRPRDQATFARELDDALWQAARDVVEWPDQDLFESR